MTMPAEFTPEITDDFYNKLARPIQAQTAQNVGLARGEALARGQAGDPLETSGVSAARNNGANALTDANAGLQYEVAGLGRQERLGALNRSYSVEDRNYANQQRLDEDERRQRMQQLGWDHENDMAKTQSRMALQALPGQLAASAVGGLSGGFGAGLAKKFLGQ